MFLRGVRSASLSAEWDCGVPYFSAVILNSSTSNKSGRSGFFLFRMNDDWSTEAVPLNGSRNLVYGAPNFLTYWRGTEKKYLYRIGFLGWQKGSLFVFLASQKKKNLLLFRRGFMVVI